MITYRYLDEYGQHLHEIGRDGEWFPLKGCSTIAKTTIDKSAMLIPWAIGQSLTYIKDNSDQSDVTGEYCVSEATLEIAKTAHKRSMSKSADKGIDMHAVLEVYVDKCIESGVIALDETVPEFSQWAVENVKRFIYSEAHCYSTTHWTGGIVDVCGELLDGTLFVGDFKSSKEAYIEHFVQIALYDIMLKENGAVTDTGKKMGEWAGAGAYIVFPFRSKPFTPESITDVTKIKQVAINCIANYDFKLWFDEYKKTI